MPISIDPNSFAADGSGMSPTVMAALANTTNANIEAAGNAAAGAGGAASGGAGQVSAGAKMAADAQGAMAALVGTSKAAQSAADYETLVDFGFKGDTDARREQIALSADIFDALPKLRAQGQKLEKLNSVSFLDSPLQWLVNQIQIPIENDRYAAAAQRIHQDRTALGTLSGLANEAHAQNAFANQVDFMAVAKEQANEALGKAQEIAGNAAIHAAGVGVSAANVRLAATEAQMRNAVLVNEAAQKQTQMQQEAQRLEMTKGQQFFIQRAADQENSLRTFQIALASEEASDRDMLQKGVDRLNELNITKNLTIRTLKIMDPASQKALIAVMATGNDIIYGASPITALELTSSIPNLARPNNPREDSVRNSMTSTAQSVFTDPNIRILDKRGQGEAYNKAVLESNAQVQKNIPDQGSWMSPMTIAELNGFDGLKDNRLMQVLSPLAGQKPNQVMSGDYVLATVLDQVNKGKLTADQAAAQAAQIFSTMSASINQVSNINRYGQSGLTSKTGYNQAVDYGSFKGTMQSVDLTKQAVWGNLIRRRQARDTAVQATPPGM